MKYTRLLYSSRYAMKDKRIDHVADNNSSDRKENKLVNNGTTFNSFVPTNILLLRGTSPGLDLSSEFWLGALGFCPSFVESESELEIGIEDRIHDCLLKALGFCPSFTESASEPEIGRAQALCDVYIRCQESYYVLNYKSYCILSRKILFSNCFRMNRLANMLSC